MPSSSLPFLPATCGDVCGILMLHVEVQRMVLPVVTNYEDLQSSETLDGSWTLHVVTQWSAIDLQIKSY